MVGGRGTVMAIVTGCRPPPPQGEGRWCRGRILVDPPHAAIFLSNLLSQFLLCPLLCLHTKTGDCSRSLRSRTEGDGSGKPKAWEAAPRLTRRPALSSVFWRVDTGRGHGLEFDGGPQCSPPQSQVRPFFVDTCIHADISRKQYHSLTFAGGERPQDDKQVCVAVHPVTF